jgi:ABC-2 type transport system permease protein
MSVGTPTAPRGAGQAVIADRRFQHYQGQRRGVGYAFLSLYLYSVGWVLGLKRSARYKIVPALFLLAAFGPAAIIVVVAIIAPPGTPLPNFWDLYGFTLPPIYVFVAITVPELICPDRRHGTLRMYMTSNLNPGVYVAAKVAAAWTVLGIVTLLPILFVLGGYSFVGFGPDSALHWFRAFGQVVAAGAEFALFYGTLALAIASLTDRNSFASAGIILTFILTGAALGILQGPLKAPDWVELVNINTLPNDLMLKIFQQPIEGLSLQTWQLASGVAAWVTGGLAVMAYRYRGEARK